MPIIGLSNREVLDPRFKEIGRIRKGAPKSGNRPGRDLKYFRYVPDSRHQESAKVFEDIYGKEPRSLEIHFALNYVEQVFGSWREAYGTNRLCKLRCDGARWHDWIEGDRHCHSEAGRECDLDYRDTDSRCPTCPLSYVGRLSVILKPMWEKGQIGMVTVITTSVNDIAHVAAKLVQWEPLSGQPFTLWRETERIGAPIDGQRKGIDSDLLHLELAESQLLLEFGAMERRAQARLWAPEQATVAQIAASNDAPPDLDYDGELIDDDEFLREGDFHGAPKDADAADDLKADDEAEAERDAAIETPPFLVPPKENDWNTFFYRCVGELNYETPAEAAIIRDQVWLKDPRPLWADLWEHMVNRQHEKGHL